MPRLSLAIVEDALRINEMSTDAWGVYISELILIRLSTKSINE